MESGRGAHFDEATARSSSADLSTPPGSPPSEDVVHSDANSTIKLAGGSLSSKPASANTVKQPRKKREPAPKDGAAKEKKPRKPRAPKDSNNAAPTSAPARKRQKVSDAKMTPQPQHQQAETLHTSSTTQFGNDAKPTPQPAKNLSNAHNTANLNSSNNTASHMHPAQQQSALPVAPTPSARPASSGQHYDPIRSVSSHNGTPAVSPPTRIVNRASASPSITSLIDPPGTSIPILSSTSVPQSSRFQHPQSVTSAPVSPAATTIKQMPFANSSASVQNTHQHPHTKNNTSTNSSTTMEMDIDHGPAQVPAPAIKKSDSTGGHPSNAPTPPAKVARSKDTTALVPSGSGLLSGSAFGLIDTSSSTNGTSGTNICLSFPLRGQTNITINFAREVEKKYGFAALHPRIAAHRERMRQMAAAGAALERAAGGGSADDMSLDLSEPDSNVEMGGVDGEGSNGDGKKKRKKKVEDYDKEDDFIDDTELAWEQSALMAKDGFFVYSGPLITEGDKPAVERADGTVKRGRGRGRGGTTRGDGTGRGRGGGGRGSRGGATVRKPRVTKADRALMEQEKAEREKMAATLAAKPQPPMYASMG
ncbi:HPC2-domain-containing protein [Patellaria atrata CBS 101060]|uniref:HPC2-domain-containing protein n=1 Tax=Patellaria atrata CBS 101060 TaxID=1346257 RepID=A0A9P4VR84_9PEZI|nr:HPC2-domain-containing protein [Patellaria atrata CBS 101060]